MSNIQQRQDDIVDAATSMGSQLIPVWAINDPNWMLSWSLAVAVCGGIMRSKRNRVIEFEDLLNRNKLQFTKEILESEEFQDGFLVTVEEYLTQRSELKRKVIQRIFLGFTSSVDKNNFELEKFYATLNLLSYPEIKGIEYIRNVLIPDQIIRLKDAYQRVKDSYKGDEDAYLKERTKNGTMLEVIIFENDKRRPDDFSDGLQGLVQLGICRREDQSVFGGTTSAFYLTNLGRRFMEYMEEK